MVLDWIIIIVMLVGLIEGIIKGVIQQVFSLGGLILGIILGTLLYEPFAGLLLSIFRMSDQTARIVAFVIILLLVPHGMRIVRKGSFQTGTCCQPGVH